MPSSYTARARYTLQNPGENNNTWGSLLNTGTLQLVEDSVMGTVAIVVSGAVTLTSVNGATDQARMAVLQCSGTGGTITAPGVQKRYLIDASAATGAIVVTTGAGTSATVEAGNIMEVYCPDGTNFLLCRDTDIATAVASEATARTNGDSATLASAKAYTDTKQLSGANLPGGAVTNSYVYTNSAGNPEWYVQQASDIEATLGFTPANAALIGNAANKSPVLDANAKLPSAQTPKDCSFTEFNESTLAAANISGTTTFDASAYTTTALQTQTANATVAFSAASQTAGVTRSLELRIASGSYTLAWPTTVGAGSAPVKWRNASGAPAPSTTGYDLYIVTFVSTSLVEITYTQDFG